MILQLADAFYWFLAAYLTPGICGMIAIGLFEHVRIRTAARRLGILKAMERQHWAYFRKSEHAGVWMPWCAVLPPIISFAVVSGFTGDPEEKLILAWALTAAIVIAYLIFVFARLANQIVRRSKRMIDNHECIACGHSRVGISSASPCSECGFVNRCAQQGEELS